MPRTFPSDDQRQPFGDPGIGTTDESVGFGPVAVTALPRYRFDREEPATPLSRKRRFIHRALRVTAVASVVGLVGASALPLLSSASETEASAAVRQNLVVDTSSEPDLSAFSATSASLKPSGATYANVESSAVQFPFADGVATLTDGFGYRTAPVAQFHDAQDFAAPAGTPISIIADGTVAEAGYSDDGCGFGLKVDHEIDGEEVSSRYCHMELASHSYAVGDSVSVGDEAGRVGNTGMSFGPHLHLVIKVAGTAVDPLPFLTEHNDKD
ncbi:hypothetical protein K8P10_001637 [Leucobacter sp. Psy1]|uniref:M23 family metallopeptidase n=1 Tax=Leucobacter sp. Psy1 TaxID=2875729 RepID=UPI001CD52275|nr:M23 family metallopeptidase [Leucobacter sp. Psy1]UBH06126.1 hypothetical protein K8P10_001637 [Leucobacter sp. Psy1]